MKVEKLIPEVYFSQSRDFSYIGRLLEILYNYMKTNSDCISANNSSVDIDATTVELIALTLGFESKHRYSTKDLIYIISSFSELIRKKGTKESINTAIRLLINSQKIVIKDIEDFVGNITATGQDRFILDIKIPEHLTDIILLEDLFDYILPAGMLYRFNKVIPQPPKKLSIKSSEDSDHIYTTNQNTSEVLYNKEGGFAYIPLMVEPEYWNINYIGYYTYDNANKKFILNEDPIFRIKTFYKKERNTDVGTILTGTVYDGSSE